ncbi:hypothetical protein RCH10_004656, partial [Variovorax sp. GrIS 2.14]|uniref:hypothetical protein n=1 Tax=Variovorax sp. GrIS 2.14 TaxID=3071709 RepID=UPI0038F69376
RRLIHEDMAQPRRLRRPGRGLKTDEKSGETELNQPASKHKNSDAPRLLAAHFDKCTTDQKIQRFKAAR